MNWTTRRAAVIVLSVVLSVLPAACTAAPVPPPAVDRPEPLVFSETPSGFSDVPLSATYPVLRMLGKETGRTIRVQVGTDYDAIIEGMRSGAIDIGVLSPFSYVRAKKENPALIPVAAQTSEKGGEPGYHSYGIVRAGSPIKSLADFRGHRICFVDQHSTSGYVYPEAALRDAGIGQQDIVPLLKGNHQAVVEAVVDGQCDAGFAYDTMVDRQLIERGKLQPGQVTVVWRSVLIPGALYVLSDRLPADLRDRLLSSIRTNANSDYLRANGFCQGECPLGDANAYSYTAVDDAFYDQVRDFCRRGGEESC
ncbi:phosphate/phosphite/phosphonate ABC transporter substrate-binding protein [Actinokineospora inagensis]|uniref:phosphate/phosphite/phosphonate ABC transporter substrate-binding protein n=1 Tax=Actinokineospora inagensis TaxID=103730 RepID=UPI00040CE2E8|nr:phosphate/phosphite/phosphonate ABC transporter substrate-binding protein [Actinokineospora inagensis]